MFTRLITNYGTKETTFFRYGFELTITERQYLFFVNTYEEFANWTRLFKLIVEMNNRKIPVTLINPFDYELLVQHKAENLQNQNKLPPVPKTKKRSARRAPNHQ